MAVALAVEPIIYWSGSNDLCYSNYSLVYSLCGIPFQLFLLGICVLLHKPGMILSYIVCLIYLAYIACAAFLALVLHSYISRFYIMLIQQTEPGEILDFFRYYPYSGTIAILLLGAIALALLILYIRNFRKAIFPKASWLPRLTIVLLMIVPQFCGDAKTIGGLIPLIKDHYICSWMGCPFVMLEVRFYMQTKKSRISSFSIYRHEKEIEDLKYPDMPMNVAIILGESATKKHLQAYGYNRETTPFLSIPENHWAIYKHAVAANCYTCGAIPFMFTDMQLEQDVNEIVRFMPLLKKAGFQTAYISKQFCGGDDNLIRKTFEDADVIQLQTYYDHMHYDECLLPEMEKFFQQDTPRKLAVIHIMGSHIDYKQRYPKEQFSKFTSDNRTIDEYDNSILYTDHLLENVRKQMEALPNSLVIYISDHGDSPEENRRNYNNPCIWQIPFCIWMSNDYKQAFPEKAKLAAEHQDTEFQADIFFEICCWLCGIDYRGFQECNVPFSKLYKPRPLKFDIVNDDFKYSD